MGKVLTADCAAPTPRDLLSYLRDMGWADVAVRVTETGGQEGAGSAGAPASSQSSADPLESSSLGQMAGRIAACQKCRLAGARTQVVFGVGNEKARVVFVGEGPGADEDRLGEPFVGRAGQLLNAMLRSIGLGREDVYIANIVKCRPPGNRDPEDDEAAACLPFLWRQIDLIDPVVIVTLGKVASRFILGTKAPITSYRGKWSSWRGRDVLPTLHPAYLLRSPSAKALAWADLKLVARRLAAP